MTGGKPLSRRERWRDSRECAALIKRFLKGEVRGAILHERMAMSISPNENSGGQSVYNNAGRAVIALTLRVIQAHTPEKRYDPLLPTPALRDALTEARKVYMSVKP